MGTENSTPEPISTAGVFAELASSISSGGVPVPAQIHMSRERHHVTLHMPDSEPAWVFRWARLYRFNAPTVTGLFSGEKTRGRPWCCFETSGPLRDTGWLLTVECFADADHKTVIAECAALAERQNIEREARERSEAGQ